MSECPGVRQRAGDASGGRRSLSRQTGQTKAGPVRAEAVSAAGDFILGIGGVSAGLWAIYTYRKSRRVDAARWVTDIFTVFYRDPAFLGARDVFEYQYWTTLRQLVEFRVTDRHITLSAEAQDAIRATDLILNFMEQLLYLEEENHIGEKDRSVFFSYWFSLLEYPCRAGLRRYLARCGYERCADAVGAVDYEVLVPPPNADDLTFLAEQDGFAELKVELPLARLENDGYTLCPTVETYTAYVVPPSRQEETFRAVDAVAGYNSASPESSSIRRICLPDTPGEWDVWVYICSSDVERMAEILPEAGGAYVL